MAGWRSDDAYCSSHLKPIWLSLPFKQLWLGNRTGYSENTTSAEVGNAQEGGQDSLANGEVNLSNRLIAQYIARDMIYGMLA